MRCTGAPLNRQGPMESFLFQATIYLGAAVIAVPLAARLGLGSVLGYLLAGIVIGPVLGLVGTETVDLQHFAEFGVVMMLFLIGLELEPRALWDMRHRLIGLGGAQIGLTTALIMAAGMFLGLAWPTALAVGMIFALSSTAIVLQTLSEKGLMQTGGGRSTFSVLLTQDIAVIPMLALLPLLVISAPVAFAPDGSMQLVTEDQHASAASEGALSLVEGLPGWGVTLVTLGAVAVIILAGIFLTRPVFRYIHHARLREMYTALALLMVVSIAVLMGMVGLSPALGTFLARLFKLHGRDRWLFTLGLAQAGEFGFVLISFSLQQGVLGQGLSETLLLVVALSMLVTPLLFIVFELLSRNMTGDQDHPADEIDEVGQVIIAGIGRFGQVVNRLVQASGFSTVVIDNNLTTVQTMRTFGFKGFFGDPTRPDLLHAAGLDDATVLVVALDDRAASLRLVRYARKERPDLHIVARAHDRIHVYELYQAGADDIVREMFDSSLRAGRYVLENMGLSEFEANEAEMAFYHQDRASLRDLAELWKPDVPIEQNAAYVARAREMNKALETELTAKLDDEKVKRGAAGGRPKA